MIHRISGAIFAALFAVPLFAAEMPVLTVTPESAGTFSAPRGAQRIEMLTLHLKADCTADVAVEEVHLLRRGLGFHTDLEAVYAEFDGSRVSTTRQPQRDGSVDLQLRGVVIPKCTAEDLHILVDLSATADIAGEHRLELQGDDAVFALGATVTVEADTTPVGRNVIRTVSDDAGSVTVSYLRLLKTPRYGGNRVVARLTLSAEGRDQKISQITLSNGGSARDGDLRSLFFSSNRGERLSLVTARMNRSTARIRFEPPLIIKRGSTRTLELHADIFSGIRRTIRFTVEQPSDIVVETVRGRKR